MKRYKEYDDLQKHKKQDANIISRHNRSNSFHPKTQQESFSVDDHLVNDGSVTVYVRSASRKGFKMNTKGKLQLNEIKDAIYKQLKIQHQNQVIYINGKNVSKYRSLQLHHNQIIHVSDQSLICDSQSNLQIKLKIINQKSDKGDSNRREYEFNVQSMMKVSDFVEMLAEKFESLKQDAGSAGNIYLFESSRFLDHNKTFYQHNISKSTQIICFSSKNDVKINFINDTKEDIINDINELMGFDNEEESKTIINRPKRHTEYEINTNFLSNGNDGEKNVIIQDIEVKKDIIEVETPQKPLNNSQSLPNFKKKSNAFIYSSPGDSIQKAQKPLATKIRSSKTKTQIEIILNSKPNGLVSAFQVQTPQAEIRQNSKTIEVHKPDPVIPKTMPINQRRKIRQQIDKLFDFDATQNRQDNLQQIPILQTNFMEQNGKIELSPLQDITPPSESTPNEMTEEKPFQKIQQKCKPLDFRTSFSSRPKFLNFLNKNAFS